MGKVIPKNEDEVLTSIALIIRYIESGLESSYNRSCEFSFNIIEENVFLFIEALNGNIENKINLNIDRLDLSRLYMFLYTTIKNNYLENKFVTINMQEIRDLTDLNNSFLSLNISDIHRNRIKICLTDLGFEKEVIDVIKADWLELVEAKKSSKSL